MKKSLIALAIAGAMAAPIVAQADATLYGGVETRLKFAEDKDADLYVDKAEMGVKGSSDLENLDGVKATYQIEFRLNANGSSATAANDSNVNGDVIMRKANVGLVGGFGIVQVGRQNRLTEASEGYTDIMMSAGNNFMNNDRVGNALTYVTPNMAGFEAYAQLIVDGGNDDAEEDVDGYTVGFNYALMGLDLSVGYAELDGNYTGGVATAGSAAVTTVDSNGDTVTLSPAVAATSGKDSDDTDLILVGLGYSIGDLGLGATYEKAEQGSSEDEMYALAATYALGDTTLKAVYGENFNDGGGNNDEQAYAVQAAYKLGKKAGVKAEYAVLDPDNADSTDTVTLSYYVNF